MAQKRMFDRAIIDTDRFMDLPIGTKAIYFLLGMEADDEGFVSYKKVMRIHGGSEDDIKVLSAKGFIIRFPSGVIVITDWNKNNYLDKNRMRQTEYQKEKAQLILTDNNTYVFNKCSTSIEERSIEEYRGEQDSIVTPLRGVAVKKATYSPDGALIIKAFEDIDVKNKTYYGNKTQRSACDFLINEYGLDVILATIPKLKETNRSSVYQITTPVEMRDKITKVFNDLSRKKVEIEKPKVNIY